MFYTPVSSLSHSFSKRTSFRYFITLPLSIPLLHYPYFLKELPNFPSCCNLNPLLPVLSTMDTEKSLFSSPQQLFQPQQPKCIQVFLQNIPVALFWILTRSLCTKPDIVLLSTSITKCIIQEIFLFQLYRCTNLLLV